MTRIVLDASVAVPWFVPEDDATTRAASEILDSVVDGRLVPLVPELFWFELLATLIRRTPAPGSAGQALAWLTELGFERIPLDPELAARAEEIARTYHVTGYDAAYAALAESTHAQWWTFDRKAHQRILDLRVSHLVGA